MPWLFFALSAACFAIAFRTLSLGVAGVFLLLALGLLLAGALGLASARIQSRSQSAAAMLGPEQAALIRKRAMASAASATATGAAPGPGADAGAPRNDPPMSPFGETTPPPSDQPADRTGGRDA
jgi:predicted lipid-binding transport protein (Tim44 family)